MPSPDLWIVIDIGSNGKVYVLSSPTTLISIIESWGPQWTTDSKHNNKKQQTAIEINKRCQRETTNMEENPRIPKERETLDYVGRESVQMIHETSRECMWLRSISQYIKWACKLTTDKEVPTVLFEDNVACKIHLKARYIKGDRMKHISSKFFYTHDLQESSEINIQQIRSCDNLDDLFTKALLTTTFEKLVRKIDLSNLKNLKGCCSQAEGEMIFEAFLFPSPRYFLLNFFCEVFNQTSINRSDLWPI